MNYKNIMVAVDGSATADLALAEAIYMAKSFKAHLYVIHVVDEFPIQNLALGVDFERYREIIKEDGLTLLKKAETTAQKNAITAETILVEILDSHKKISERILQEVLSHQVDLLILGTHGRRGFRRLMLGSVAEETIRMANVPVLLVRAEG